MKLRNKSVILILLLGLTIISGVYALQKKQSILKPKEKQEKRSLGQVTSNLKFYKGKEYRFFYPSDYKVIPRSENYPVLTVKKGDNQKLEIFKMKDFGGDRSFDWIPPKKKLKVGSGENQYDVWIYYNSDDTETKHELESIFDSIEVYNK